MSGGEAAEGRKEANLFRASLRLASVISAPLYLIGLRIWRQLMLLSLSCCLLLGVAARASAQSRALVQVHPECTAHQDQLFLGDLAEISAAEAETTDRLRAIPLGYAPEVGALRELSKEKIALAIAAAGFPTGTVTIDAPPATVIRREAQVIDPSLVRAAVERSALAGLQSRGATARLVRLDLPPRIEVRTGAVEVRAALGGVRNLFTAFAASVEIWIDGRIARRLSATAQVEAYAPVLVAAHDLTEKTRLRTGDFTIAVKKLDRDPACYLNDPLQLRGVSLIRALSGGAAITTDAFVPEIVIKPGDPVRISGESGSLKIMVAGEARAAGHVGDRILVKNLQSGLLFQAVIVDEGLVSVRF